MCRSVAEQVAARLEAPRHGAVAGRLENPKPPEMGSSKLCGSRLSVGVRIAVESSAAASARLR